MQKPVSKKPIIIIVIVLVLAAAAYFYFSGSPTDTAATLDAEQTPEGALVGAEVLTLLNEISALSIDSTLFDSQAYKSLVDHTVVVPEQNIGRFNPFVPVGALAKPAVKSSSGSR